MKCPVCGNEISESGKFCPVCGSPVTKETSISPQGAATRATENVGRKYRFSRAKGFSYINYKDIDTTITIDGMELLIQTQTTWFAFFKRPAVVTRIPIRQIQTISKRRTVGIWDLIYAVAFLLAGLSYSRWWLLLAVFALFCALAVKYTVECDGHENVSFTADLNGSDAQVEELFRTITQMKKNANIG